MFSMDPPETRVFVKQGKMTKMGPAEFLNLAVRCGMELMEVDLAQLARRKLIIPWDSGRGDSWYTELHLYVLAQYFRAVRPTRHPWGTRPADITLDEIAKLAEEANHFLDAAFDADKQGDFDAQEREFIVGVERFLARIDPFGPLGGVFDLLQASVVANLRHSGRLFLEVKGVVTELTGRLEGNGQSPEQDEPKTQQMFGELMPPDPPETFRSTQVIGGDDRAVQTREAIDEVLSAASEATLDEASEPTSPRGDFNSIEPTQVIQIPEEPSLAEESSVPIVLDDSPVVKQDDQVEAERASPEPEGPPPSPVERIAELNRRREVYMKEQAWDDLVELYEDGIGLFSDPRERRQIFLALATLYEVKLRNKERAFDTFARAWAEGSGEKSREKAWSGLRRLGKEASLHGKFLAWLKEQIDGTIDPAVEPQLQKEFALGLFADEKYRRAFAAWAAYLVSDPERNMSSDRLHQLVRFGEHVEQEVVATFFEELRSADLGEETRDLVEEFTP